ncbi:hypothetical protein DV515_00013564 [Chloebia gouldiae]|uniref:Uncharacterized protein n=1 Tax=Chloebia gouldiae TaxID=44316 RepID=A0A3L8S107_CHLGU|nr:hypothetical protein DV515_00013564 [Chloebia gouldiae]
MSFPSVADGDPGTVWEQSPPLLPVPSPGASPVLPSPRPAPGAALGVHGPERSAPLRPRVAGAAAAVALQPLWQQLAIGAMAELPLPAGHLPSQAVAPGEQPRPGPRSCLSTAPSLSCSAQAMPRADPACLQGHALYLYGFHKVPGSVCSAAPGDAGARRHCSNPCFRRDRPDLLLCIRHWSAANRQRPAAGREGRGHTPCGSQQLPGMRLLPDRQDGHCRFKPLPREWLPPAEWEVLRIPFCNFLGFYGEPLLLLGWAGPCTHFQELCSGNPIGEEWKRLPVDKAAAEETSSGTESCGNMQPLGQMLPGGPPSQERTPWLVVYNRDRVGGVTVERNQPGKGQGEEQGWGDQETTSGGIGDKPGSLLHAPTGLAESQETLPAQSLDKTLIFPVCSLSLRSPLGPWNKELDSYIGFKSCTRHNLPEPCPPRFSRGSETSAVAREQGINLNLKGQKESL